MTQVTWTQPLCSSLALLCSPAGLRQGLHSSPESQTEDMSSLIFHLVDCIMGREEGGGGGKRMGLREQKSMGGWEMNSVVLRVCLGCRHEDEWCGGSRGPGSA